MTADDLRGFWDDVKRELAEVPMGAEVEPVEGGRRAMPRATAGSTTTGTSTICGCDASCRCGGRAYSRQYSRPSFAPT